MDAAWVSAISSCIMTVVWLAYLNVFLWEFRNQHRARVFVQLYGGYHLDAVCRLVNMSEKPVSVSCVQLLLEFEDEQWVVEITDEEIERAAGRGGSRFPGSLQSAESVDLGSFRNLVAVAVRQKTGGQGPVEREIRDLRRLTMRMVVLHGASDRPGAVQRTFVVEDREGRWGVVPEGDTRLWYSRHGQRLAQEWMRTNIELRGLVQ